MNLKNTKRTWLELYDLLLTYEGILTEIVILDITGSNFSDILNNVNARICNLQILNIETSPGSWKNIPYTNQLEEQLMEMENFQMKGEMGLEKDLLLYFNKYETGNYVVEVIFSNKTSFPPGEMDKWLAMLRKYVDLVEAIRDSSENSIAVVTIEFSGDPANIFESGLDFLKLKSLNNWVRVK